MEADINRLRIVENECLGAQSRGHAASLLGAEEVPGCLGLLPSGLGEVAIDLRRLIDAQGRYSARGVVRWFSARRDGCNEQEEPK